MTDTERQISILEKVLEASDKEANSLDFWLTNIKEYGIYPFAWLTELDKESIYTENGMMQVQGEFANFCRFLSGQKIQSAMEIGVWRGRSSYFICATIFRSNPELIYDMVDIVDGLADFEEFSKVLPCIRKNIPHTSADFVGKEYDFVFIDADHGYEGSMADYLNVGRYAKKMVCFHDIYAHEYDNEAGGCARTWEEICVMTPEQPKVIFSQFPNRWMGIGVVEKIQGSGERADKVESYEDLISEKKSFIDKLSSFENVWIYGSRNDSRRMYAALLKNHISVKGLLVKNEEEHVERMSDYPATYFEDFVWDEETVVVVCLRESLRELALQQLKEIENKNSQIIVVSDKLATML